MNDREVMKIESSIPVQSRVSIVTLAELEMYWESQGVRISTMSQLLSWSLEGLRTALEANEKLPKVVHTVADAHKHLEKCGLYQKSLKKRSMQKLATAMSFESMRMEGIEPEDYADRHHNMLHNSRSVRVPEDAKSRKVAAAIEKYNELYGEEGEIEMKPQEQVRREFFAKQRRVKEGASEEELEEYDKEREKDVQAAENVELDEEELKELAVKE